MSTEKIQSAGPLVAAEDTNGNIGIGQYAGNFTAGLTNSIGIGYGVAPTMSNSIVLGDTGYNVGIGTYEPKCGLHVGSGTGNTGIYIEDANFSIDPTKIGTDIALSALNGNLMVSNNSGTNQVLTISNVSDNSTCGQAILSGAVVSSVTIESAQVTPNSLIFVTRQGSGVGALSITSVMRGSFTVSSATPYDKAMVAWWFFNPFN